MTQTSDLRQTILDMKIARIIALYSEGHNVSLAEAADIYYSSLIAKQIEAGTADLHCRSDKYLADELWLEMLECQKTSLA